MEKTLVNRGKGQVCNSDAERVAREVRMHLQIGSTGGGEAGGRGRRVSTLLLTRVRPSASTPRSDTASGRFSATP